MITMALGRLADNKDDALFENSANNSFLASLFSSTVMCFFVEKL